MPEEIVTIDLGFVNAHLKAKKLADSIGIVYPGDGRSFPGAAILGIEL